MSQIFSDLNGLASCTPGLFGWSPRCVGGALVVSMSGELDLATSAELRERLWRVVRSSDVATIVLDLSGVCFIDAHSIGLIVAARAEARVHGRVLQVDGLQGIPAHVFRVLGLDCLLARPTRDEARGGDSGGRSR